MSATKNYYRTISTVKLFIFVLTVRIAVVLVMVVELNLCYSSYLENFID